MSTKLNVLISKYYTFRQRNLLIDVNLMTGNFQGLPNDNLKYFFTTVFLRREFGIS